MGRTVYCTCGQDRSHPGSDVEITGYGMHNQNLIIGGGAMINQAPLIALDYSVFA